jgi:hypothetical protein
MATDRDDDVSRRYRSLARDEPGPALDAAILAASRRAVGSRPGGIRRWGPPVSIAAVLVLASGVVLRMQMEQPGVETSMPATTVAPPAGSVAPRVDSVAPADRSVTPHALEPQKHAAPAAARAPQREKKAVKPEPLPESVPPAQASGFAAPAASAPAPASIASAPEAVAPSAPPPQRSPPTESRSSATDANVASEARREAAAPAPRAKALSLQKEMRDVEAPEAILERIARLRSEGRAEEADRALETFRRDHPDYRIPDAMWERVKPRAP